MEPAAQVEDHTSLEVVSGSGEAIQHGMAAIRSLYFSRAIPYPWPMR